MGEKELAVRVVVNTPANAGLFDYFVPQALQDKIRRGQMVVIPFNHTVHQAVVWAVDVVPEVKQLLKLISIVDEEPILTAAQLALAEKISERSYASLADCVNLLLTERIRNISHPVYFLTSNTRPLQGMLFGQADLLSEMIAFFEKSGGPVDEEMLARQFKDREWRSALNTLVGKGEVRREMRFEIPGESPRMIKVVTLTGCDAPIPGRGEQVLQRRAEILGRLKEAGGTLPQSELTKLVPLPDLAALEKAGLITRHMAEVFREHKHYMLEPVSSEHILNAEQTAALETIRNELPNPQKPILLHGVTGSGKTEVYLQAASAAIEAGKQVLVLVPEISLTPQILSRFEERFPAQVGVYHSRLQSGERYDTWRRGRSGEYRIIVGPRSAFSVPLPQLGLIIVDECHEDAYYQTNEPPYFSAVRAATDYADITGSLLILGSATPTTAQMFKAEKSGWHIIKMKERATGVRPPDVKLVDMREELKRGNTDIFSALLLKEIQKTLDMGRQTILFLNRRGTASYTFCHTCGEDFRCPNCDIPYTWHADRNRLECHYCGRKEPLPLTCPTCGSSEIRQFGEGVEKIETLVAQRFPEARVLRIDADTAEGAGKHEQLLSQFAEHQADILVGTQMIAKGLDFPGVRLVGILLADVGSNFHDYRVDEHAFQMLLQVSGRAGRGDEPGLAILQTYQPQRYSIRAVVNGNYENFYTRELDYRKVLGYPPFSRMVRLEVSDPSSDRAEYRVRNLESRIRANIQARKLGSVRLIGPAPCYFARLRKFYRWHLILRGIDPVAALEGLDLTGVKTEIDPPSLL